MHRLNPALLTTAVAQGAPHGLEPLGEGTLTDALVGPELCQEFVFGDDTIAMLHEVDEHVEALALECTEGAAVAELIALRIEFVIAKDIDHAPAPSLRLVTLSSL
jgi:hypothetical protein